MEKIIAAIGIILACALTFAWVDRDDIKPLLKRTITDADLNEMMAKFTVRECTESESASLPGKGWSRMQAPDERLAISQKVRGIAEIAARPLKCRFWYDAGNGQLTFVDIQVNQLWWRTP